MITGSYLGEIRARCEGVRDLVIEIADGSDGRAKVLARRGASVVEGILVPGAALAGVVDAIDEGSAAAHA